MSIFDTLNDDNAENPENPESEEGSSKTFVLQYGTESVTIALDGDDGAPETLEAALNAYSADLGFDRSRTVTFRSGAEILSASSTPVAGQHYIASVQHEAKG